MRRRSSKKWPEHVSLALRGTLIGFLVLLVFSAIVDEEGEGGEASVKVNVSETVGFVKDVDDRIWDVFVSSGNWISSVIELIGFLIKAVFQSITKTFRVLAQVITGPLELLKKIGRNLRRTIQKLWRALRRIGRVSGRVLGKVADVAKALFGRFDWLFYYPRRLMSAVLGFVKNMGTFWRCLWHPVRDMLWKIWNLFVDFSWTALLDVLITPYKVAKWAGKTILKVIPAKDSIGRILLVVLRLPLNMFKSLLDLIYALVKVGEKLFLIYLQAFQYIASWLMEFVDVVETLGRVFSVVGEFVLKIAKEILHVLERVFSIPLRFLMWFKPLFVAIWTFIARSARGLKRAVFGVWGTVTNLPRYVLHGVTFTLRILLRIEVDVERVKAAIKEFFWIPVRLVKLLWSFCRFLGQTAAKPVQWTLDLLYYTAIHFKRGVFGIKWIDVFLSPFRLVRQAFRELAQIPWLGALFKVVNEIFYRVGMLFLGLYRSISVLLNYFWLALFSNADLRRLLAEND